MKRRPRTPWPRIFAPGALVLALAWGGAAAAQDAAQELAAALDGAFAAGSVEGYLQRFADRSWLPMLLQRRRLARLMSAGTLRRRSRVLEVRRFGDRHVALLERVYECVGAAEGARTARSHAYLVFQDGARPRARFEIACGRPHSRHIDPEGVFTCPACNYRIGAPGEWLVVEHAPQRTGCVESVSFYALRHDLCLEVSVRFGTAPKPARRVLEEQVELLAAHLGARAIGPVQPWLPVSCRRPGAARAAMRGARARLRWRPADRPREVLLHVLTHGRRRYVLAAHGTEESLRRNGAILEALLDTFELVDPSRGERELDDLASRAHTGGGVLHQTTFRNEAHHIRFRGPAGWSAELRPGPWAFGVRYTCPSERGVLDVLGYEPPPGFTQWTQPAADADLDRLRRRAKLEVVSDSGWRAPADQGPERRDVVLRPSAPRPGPQELIVRLVRYQDLLVVATARIFDGSVRDVVRRALDSVVRD